MRKGTSTAPSFTVRCSNVAEKHHVSWRNAQMTIHRHLRRLSRWCQARTGPALRAKVELTGNSSPWRGFSSWIAGAAGGAQALRFPHRDVAHERRFDCERIRAGGQNPSYHPSSCPLSRASQTAKDIAAFPAISDGVGDRAGSIGGPVRRRTLLPLPLASLCRRDRDFSLPFRSRVRSFGDPAFVRPFLVFLSRTRHRRISVAGDLRRFRAVHRLPHRGAALLGRTADAGERESPFELGKAPEHNEHP